MKTKWFIIAALSVVFAFARFASAAEEHEHKEGKDKIPATAAGIWHEVREHEEELSRIITDKNLDKVHEIAFEIRDLVSALPDKSTDLPADKLAKVKSNAKYVADIAKRLDESGDAGDQVVTEANFKKLQGFLKTIEAQYPPEILAMSKVKKIPETLGGIWHEVNEGKEELDKIIEDKKLDEVHKTAFEIRDLVNLMPEKSRDLPEDKQKSLKESIKRVGEIAGLLDKYGDAGDEANTKEQVKRLEKLLKYIESLYPEGALKSPDEEEEHHEDKEHSSHKEGHH